MSTIPPSPDRTIALGVPDADAGVHVAISDISITFTQEADSCDENSNGYQFLKITTEDAGAGTYFVIETQRWAVDNLEDLTVLLKDAMLRATTDFSTLPGKNSKVNG